MKKNITHLVKCTDVKSPTKIWPILEVFGHKWGNLTWIKLLITEICNLLTYKIFIFGQVMAKNGVHAHIWLYVFWPGWKFLWKLRRLLSIVGGEKSKLWCLFFSFGFLGHFWWGNGRENHASPIWFWASKPDQKFGPPGGPFESPAISKSCLRNVQGWTPPPPLI